MHCVVCLWYYVQCVVLFERLLWVFLKLLYFCLCKSYLKLLLKPTGNHQLGLKCLARGSNGCLRWNSISFLQYIHRIRVRRTHHSATRPFQNPWHRHIMTFFTDRINANRYFKFEWEESR